MAGNISYPEFLRACRSFIEKSHGIGDTWQERTSKVYFLFMNAWVALIPCGPLMILVSVHQKRHTLKALIKPSLSLLNPPL